MILQLRVSDDVTRRWRAEQVDGRIVLVEFDEGALACGPDKAKERSESVDPELQRSGHNSGPGRVFKPGVTATKIYRAAMRRQSDGKKFP